MQPLSSGPPLNCLSATQAVALLTSRQVTAEQFARACLTRVTERERSVGAWTYIDTDHVLAQARALDAGAVRGILHGLPVGVKDIIDSADMPTEYGSPIYSNYRPRWDAACVAAVRAAGGIIMGKTVTTEFATSHPGKTTNPHNPAHTPGGSSSGSAAAVADYMVPLAIGTQTGGSVIRPASFCGVVGYKPSFGLINRHGVRPLSETLDTVGLFARTISDVALLANAITGRSDLQRFGTNAPRIGVWRTNEWQHAAPETAAALNMAAQRLACAGAQVSEPAMPPLFSELAAAHHEIEYFELARALAFEMQHHAQLLTPKLRARIEHGMQCSPELYDKKLAIAAECRKLIDSILAADFDILVTPSAPGEAPEGLMSTGNSVFNRTWTLLHSPCVNIPVSHGPRGLPVGIQVIGRYWHDAKTLAYADWIDSTLS